MAQAADRWHRWLMDGRFGGDPAERDRVLTKLLYPVRDTVLDQARLRPGDTVLDVGTGDGLIAFGALERLGPSGHVVFSDISQDLLDHCRAAAAAEGLLDRCRFLVASADSLDGIADASVDVVTTRSVLIYVKNKAAALRQFYRVLRPGGRISVFEPVNLLMRDPGRLMGYDITPVKPLAAKLEAFYESIQPPSADPMLDSNERDLAPRHHVRDVQVAEPPAGGLADRGALPGDQIVIAGRVLARQRNHHSPPVRSVTLESELDRLVSLAGQQRIRAEVRVHRPPAGFRRPGREGDGLSDPSRRLP